MPNADKRCLTRKSFKSPSSPGLGLLQSGRVWHGQWPATLHAIRCNAINELSTWDCCGLFWGKQKCFLRNFYGFPCRQLRNELNQQARVMWNGISAVRKVSLTYPRLRVTNLCYLKWKRMHKCIDSQCHCNFLKCILYLSMFKLLFKLSFTMNLFQLNFLLSDSKVVRTTKLININQRIHVSKLRHK